MLVNFPFTHTRKIKTRKRSTIIIYVTKPAVSAWRHTESYEVNSVITEENLGIEDLVRVDRAAL